MTYLVGMDEAGYGPNLGPLVVSATAWRTDRPDVDLYQQLAACVSTKVCRDRVAIADSKLLYKPGGGLKHLERGLLPALALLDIDPCDWAGLWRGLAADPGNARGRLPWQRDFTTRLPVDIDLETVTELCAALRAGLKRADVRLVAVRSRTVFPAEFNALIEEHGTKGAALSTITLELLRDVLAPLDDGPAQVVCDKHGGRNRYQPLLQRTFGEWLVEVHGESRAESRYRFGPPECRREVRFCTGGEAFLPAALASMAAKYLRELSMLALNAFWQARVKNLRPTAGYPVDARRFKAEILAMQADLGIADRDLWRCR